MHILRKQLSKWPITVFISRKKLQLVFAIGMAFNLSSLQLLAEEPSRPAAMTHDLSHKYKRLSSSAAQSAFVVMLGDSLTEGGSWRDLTGCSSIANLGISGDTTKGVLSRLGDVLALQPRAVFLLIGVNDVLKGTPKETIISNFHAILDYLERSSTRTFVSYVLPIAANHKEKNSEISLLNEAVSTLIAERPGVTPIDFRPLVRDRDGYLSEESSYDGLHLSPKGYEVWRDTISPYVHEFCTS